MWMTRDETCPFLRPSCRIDFDLFTGLLHHCSFHPYANTGRHFVFAFAQNQYNDASHQIKETVAGLSIIGVTKCENFITFNLIVPFSQSLHSHIAAVVTNNSKM